jgi:hypothetical protein
MGCTVPQYHSLPQSQLLENQLQSLANEEQLLVTEQALLIGLHAAGDRLHTYQSQVNESMRSIRNKVEEEAAVVLNVISVLSSYSEAILLIHNQFGGKCS